MKPQTFVSALGIILLLKHPHLVGPDNFIDRLNFPGGKELFRRVIYDTMFSGLDNSDVKIKIVDQHNGNF